MQKGPVEPKIKAREWLVTLVGFALSVCSLQTVEEVYAQNLPEQPGFGIPLLLIMVTIITLITILALTIQFVNVQRRRIILGMTAIFSAVLIIAAATPVDMHSFYAGSSISYCENHPCNNSSVKMLDINSYDELTYSYPSSLRKAIDAAFVNGKGYCCAVTSINYFEELSMLSLLSSSTVNIGEEYSYDNAYLLRFRGEYYTVSFHHVDVDHTYVYSDTMFTIDAIFLISLVGIAFFSVALPTGTGTVIGTTGNRRSVEWIALRRHDIPIAGIVLIVLIFTLSIWLSYSSYHVSSQITVIGAVLSLLVYLTLIAAGRINLHRRRTRTE